MRFIRVEICHRAHYTNTDMFSHMVDHGPKSSHGHDLCFSMYWSRPRQSWPGSFIFR